MPCVFSLKGYKFFFFSNEGDPRERLHIHIRKGSKLAKIWLEPDMIIASSFGFSSKELNWILKLVSNRKAEIRSTWNEFFEI